MEIRQVKCKQCRKKFTPVSNGVLQFCSTDCKIDWLKTPAGQKQMKITSKVLERQHKQEVKARAIRMKESVKSLSDYAAELQKEINLIVKLIDVSHPCISSGKMPKQRQSGHYFSTGFAGFLRFNLFNIYVQGVWANQYLSGDLIRYRIGLATTFGDEHFDYVESLKQKYQHLKFSKDFLKEKIVIAREIVRELKKQDLTYSTLERLELRELYNAQIGIYL